MYFKDFTNEIDFEVKKDIKTFDINEITKLINKKKSSMFEWLKSDTLVKPYYDVDLFYENDNNNNVNDIKLQNEVLNKLKIVYGETAEIAVSSSHGIKKKRNKIGYTYSYHFVINGFEGNVDDVKKYNEDIKIFEYEFNDGNKMFDKSVYRKAGMMRLLGSTKPNDNRIKTAVNFKDDITKHIIQSNINTNFNFKKLPKSSPPSSPPLSPSVSEDDFECIESKKYYNEDELKKILNIISHKDNYDYQSWIAVGIALYNITEGDNIGKSLFIDWSKKDTEGFDIKKLNISWNSFKSEGREKKLGYTFLKNLKNKYTPKNELSLQLMFQNNYKETNSKKIATEIMLNELNSRVIYDRQTSNFIKTAIETHKEYDYLGIEISTKQNTVYQIKAKKDVSDDFLKENFIFSYTDKEGISHSEKICPFNKWLEWIDRKEVEKIEFDPRTNKENKSIFNIWRGFEISKEVSEEFDDNEALPVLTHIKHIWCKGNEESFNYVMCYLAHIIQKPHIKTAVCLALKSEQGAGKGIIIKLMEQIIGDTHFSQNSNAEHLFGDFNGLIEGKILINLDEAFWGGNKKLEGQIKNKITESKQSINKKNVNQYNISDFCNYIITTNNDWFAGVEEGDRRYFCLELDNKYAGRADKEKNEYYKPLLEVRPEAFAKILYNWDITNFSPRVFKKTELLQDQVERNWNSVKVWWGGVMMEGGLSYKEKFIPLNEVAEHYVGGNAVDYGLSLTNEKTKKKVVVYPKDLIFSMYDSFSADSRKLSSRAFWKELKNNCIGLDLFVEKKIQLGEDRSMYIFFSELNVLRDRWDKFQDFKYDYIGEDSNKYIRTEDVCVIED
mgnify:CR=1 FL=1